MKKEIKQLKNMIILDKTHLRAYSMIKFAVSPNRRLINFSICLFLSLSHGFELHPLNGMPLSPEDTGKPTD